jgi:hypothetical protein
MRVSLMRGGESIALEVSCRGTGFAGRRFSIVVMAGLVPAIPSRDAAPRNPKRDARNKCGHEDRNGGRWAAYFFSEVLLRGSSAGLT